MRRPMLFALLLALLLGLPLVAAPVGMHAQDAATPAAATVTFQPVAGGDVEPAAQQAGVEFAWARFAPGASYVIPEADASLLLVAVESGALSVTSAAPLVVNRAVAGTPEAGAASGAIPAGQEVTLAAGDSFVRSPGSTQTLRNDGPTEAVALTASLGATSLHREAQRAGAPEPAGLVVAVAVVAVPQCPVGYVPAEIAPAATPGGGGGGGGAGGVAVAIAAAPECVGGAATPTP